jgi:hypothetical protein
VPSPQRTEEKSVHANRIQKKTSSKGLYDSSALCFKAPFSVILPFFFAMMGKKFLRFAIGLFGEKHLPS